jgi:hypothetical protein
MNTKFGTECDHVSSKWHQVSCLHPCPLHYPATPVTVTQIMSVQPPPLDPWCPLCTSPADRICWLCSTHPHTCHQLPTSNKMWALFIHKDGGCKKSEALLDASKEVGLEVNPEKTKYMLMSRSQKIGQKDSIKVESRSFENVAKYKYLGTTITDQNCMHEEIKSRLNSGNACYHSVQSLLSSGCCLGT